MSRAARVNGPVGLDVLEEAAHLLRSAPRVASASYLIGTVPFLLGLVYFFADMSRGARAAQHVSEAALGMTLLFAWMKAWQAIAAGRALAFLEQREPALISLRELGRIALRQFRLHAFGLIVLPVAALICFPLGWVYAYYQNLTVMDNVAGERVHVASVQQARLWWRQNHAMLLCVSLFGFFVFLNLAIAIYFVPLLLHTLLGLEDVFATIGWNPLNTTFLTVVFALTYLAVDPLIKCAYVVRCFHGTALQTGTDLLAVARTALARLAPPLTALVVIAAAAVAIALTPMESPAAESAERGNGIEQSGGASDPASVAIEAPGDAVVDSPAAVQPAELDAALDRVLGRPEYAWRLPRAETVVPETELGLLERWSRAVVRFMRRVAQWCAELMERIIRWIFETRGGGRGASGGFGLGAEGVLRLLLLILAGGLVLALLWLGWRWWQGARVKETAAAAPVVVPVLEREDVTADQLPQDEWLRLGRELWSRGEWRLAMRAFFLGSLAALAGRGLLTLARHKTNRDYERELTRRGAALAGTTGLFQENRRWFERVWYGRDLVGEEELARFESNVRRLIGGGS